MKRWSSYYANFIGFLCIVIVGLPPLFALGLYAASDAGLHPIIWEMFWDVLLVLGSFIILAIIISILPT